jgi:hypothetical protein
VALSRQASIFVDSRCDERRAFGVFHGTMVLRITESTRAVLF